MTIQCPEAIFRCDMSLGRDRLVSICETRAPNQHGANSGAKNDRHGAETLDKIQVSAPRLTQHAYILYCPLLFILSSSKINHRFWGF
jgi:hypothetical protein